MCDLCRADGNYFHTPECVYGQLVSEYPVMWLRDSTRIGACYTLRELLSPEGMVLAIQNAPPVTGWRLRMRYNEATDEEIDPQRGDCIELLSRADALQAFRSLREGTASASPSGPHNNPLASKQETR